MRHSFFPHLPHTANKYLVSSCASKLGLHHKLARHFEPSLKKKDRTMKDKEIEKKHIQSTHFIDIYEAGDYWAEVKVTLKTGYTFEAEWTIAQYQFEEIQSNKVTDFFVEWLNWALCWCEESVRDEVIRELTKMD